MVGKLTRNDRLSASRIPVLLNASPYSTPNELLAEMIDIDNGGTPNWIPQNEPMFWGDTLEDQILRVAADRLNLTNLKTSFASAFDHPTLPLGASLDGAADGNGMWGADPANGIYTPQGTAQVNLTGQVLLEAKNTSAPAETIPARHRGPLQMQAQMMCTGIKAGVVAVLYRGTDLRLFLYQADPDIQQRIKLAIEDFEERRKTRDRPYPVLSPEDGAFAYGRATRAEPLDLTDDGNAEIMLDQLMHAKEQKAHAEEDIKEMTAGLMELMGDSEEAECLVGNRMYVVKWPMRNYKAQPAKNTPAKPARTERSKTLVVKDV